MTPERMICYLLHRQIIVNHLPWRVERGWSYEVTASNGTIIAKCQTHEEAEEIIKMAEKKENEVGDMDWPVSDILEEFSRVAGSQRKDTK